jgi:DNA-cytosine methyltransferase
MLNVLSLFDGISCGRQALIVAGVNVGTYYASEIDKYAIAIAEKNHPNNIQLGDVTKWKDWDVDWSSIGLILAGPPCQAWSVAGKQLGDKDPRGALMYTMMAIVNHIKAVNPSVKFLFENVKMKKEFRNHFDKLIGCEAIEINSALVSAQNRKRLYWSNIPNITQPEDKGVYLRDVLDLGASDVIVNYSSSPRPTGIIEGRYYEAKKAHTITATRYSVKSSTGIYQVNPSKDAGGKQPYMQDRIYHIDGKSICLTAGFANRLKVTGGHIGFARKLSINELEKLQTLPVDYTYGVSDNQRGKAIGNGWNVETVAHIFKGLHDRQGDNET